MAFTFVSSSSMTKDFSVTCYFDTTDSADNAHTFQAGISSYILATGESETYVGNATITTDALYTIGDVDNDADIDLDDSYAITTIAALKSSNSVTVVYANNKLSTLRQSYPNMVCAEAADINVDGYINQTDVTLILSYYANTQVSDTYVDDIIGTKYYKSITA